MDGLADYSRNDGYVKGNVRARMGDREISTTTEAGRLFEVDSMDDEETVKNVFRKARSCVR